jgi:hypothetical protein
MFSDSAMVTTPVTDLQTLGFFNGAPSRNGGDGAKKRHHPASAFLAAGVKDPLTVRESPR